MKYRCAWLVLALVSSVPPGLSGQTQFPAPGVPYAEARSQLLRQGMAPADIRVSRPLPEFPDINCLNANDCQAVFAEERGDGWKNHVIVTVTRGANPVVRQVLRAGPIHGLPPAPPAEAADLPQLPESYDLARLQLAALGYLPMDAVTGPRGCIDTRQSVSCGADDVWPEVHNCSGTGLSYCTAFWRAPDNRVLKIMTIGEPAPGRLYFKRWADADTPEDDLFAWRPWQYDN